ncbi:DNA-binding response regulator, OmpR family, contains REC and winged-helix (wHTH) domain [Reichenbachiella agariperforans]|uniref:Phosphate regulon transcriptional regulatory protein PhoB n=1 Tax=Reichenbachiella agariperforans TaxID=156994 RepID=A0A1M6QJ56_REIAG|nr:response regulator transcription factor [Reichenbachiella agariperforans]SHK20309.1 DNA-binding response regulator, OmpR family, contains REC and winged-helix (wHTH) domain [Reichenbachiella agariperforans]
MDKKVLIIEDDESIVELLTIHLRDLHCEVSSAYRGNEGATMAMTGDYDLIVLDINLPEKDGLDVCRELRAATVLTPILMLTARSEEIDKILGLETGADDYLTKPFNIREFTARVKAIFRRSDMSRPQNQKEELATIVLGSLSIDQEKRKVLKYNERIELTPKEFDLLILLAQHPGRSYSRERLLSLVWGYEFNGYEHTVNSHINRLRAKIEDNMNAPHYILTTWGVGYRFNDELT